MIALFSHLAAAAEPSIADEHDARYLERTGRAEAAAAWYLAHRDDDPASAKLLTRWLGVVGVLPAHRSLALVEQVRRWVEAHPEAGDGGVALATAWSIAELGPRDYGMAFGRTGPWCEPALAALAELPEPGRARYRVLYARIDMAKACGTSPDADRALAEALALSGEAGPIARAWQGAQDDVVDEEDAAAVDLALDEGWWALSNLGSYAAKDTVGPGAEAARASVLAEARASAATDHPARMWAGIGVLSAADLDDEALAARTRLQTLDPGNQGNLRAMEQPDEAPEPDEEPDATTLLDPAERLAALRTAGPPRGSSWEKVQYWNALAESADAVGDTDAELEALDRLWRVDPWFTSNVRFVEAAVAAGERLGRAKRAAEAAVSVTEDAWTYEHPVLSDPDGDAWLGAVASALDARARICAARGRHDDAARDLEEALRLAEPTPDRLARLGLAYEALDRDTLAAPLLAAGVVDQPEDDPLAIEARTALVGALAELDGWTPDVETYLAAVRARTVPTEAAPEVLDGSRFADLTVQIGGEEQRLFDLEGPIVVDVWATWCGPCMQSLPHLDALAREYAGRVTFVAVSVDEELAVAERYLAARGEPAFVQAWLGADGMDRLGVSGIPAMFVFDAEHQLVATLRGWGPGSTELDDAVEAALAER